MSSIICPIKVKLIRPRRDWLPRGCRLNLFPGWAVKSLDEQVPQSREINVFTWNNTLNYPCPGGRCKYFNGTNAYARLSVLPACLNITTQKLAFFITLKIPAGATNTYIAGVNTDSTANLQYFLRWSSYADITARLQGSDKANTATNAVATDKWCDVGFIWANGKVQCYVNVRKSGSAGGFSTALTSRLYFGIGRRETAAQYFKGYIYNVAVYADTALNIKEVLDHRRDICYRMDIKV